MNADKKQGVLTRILREMFVAQTALSAVSPTGSRRARICRGTIEMHPVIFGGIVDFENSGTQQSKIVERGHSCPQHPANPERMRLSCRPGARSGNSFPALSEPTRTYANIGGYFGIQFPSFD